MSDLLLNAQAENIRTLMSLAGMSEEEATSSLAHRIAISAGTTPTAENIAREIVRLLEPTIQVVPWDAPCDTELAVDCIPRSSAATRLCLTIDSHSATVDVLGEAPPAADITPPLAGLTQKIIACYAAGQALLHTVDGLQDLGNRGCFDLRFDHLGLPNANEVSPIQLDDTVLIGAGGIANGFLWALKTLPVAGRLIIVDPKTVGAGNLNRCLLFSREDVGKSKAEVLAGKFQSNGLEVVGYQKTFKDYRLTTPRQRVKQVITTVDSREARRSIQNELPVEVIDASTTDISGIVVHSHRQPTDDACLSCIYEHIPQEDQQKRDIAGGLGLSLEDVRQPFINKDLAQKLAGLHPGFNEADFLGKALDSLFKAKCAEGSLKTSAGKQASAPFAFISNLAGALLALELWRFDSTSSGNGSNYMNLSPWQSPHGHLRRPRSRRPACAFCSKPEVQRTLRRVWPEVFPLECP